MYRFTSTTRRPHGSIRRLRNVTGARLFEFAGTSPGDELGWSVGGAGDVNLDGVPDECRG